MNIINNNLNIRSIKESDLEALWKASYRDNLEWTKWDGPYFNDPIYTKDEFMNKEGPQYYLNKDNKGIILIDDKIIGLLTYSFMDGSLKQWLEFGIVIYDSSYWNKGLGTKVCTLWIDHIFKTFPYLRHIGFTTWSGNSRMMKLGEKLGMVKEAQIRQVRYYNNQYWDSIKYGMLREEFYKD